MSSHIEPSSPLSVHRAFVVQFHADTDVRARHLMGRAEHVVSGRATHFGDLDGLLAFIAIELENCLGLPSAE